MKNRLIALLLSCALSGACLAACGSESDDPVERAAAIARDIQADPANAEEVLEDHDITIDEFEELIYEIAADPEQSQRYEAALAGEAEEG
ncbi:MAG: hypothetical protein JRH11_05585 [Deltaproteobacteria bacterium]|nr:hypothetical protein [Deltaproteobacteria bacterium]